MFISLTEKICPSILNLHHTLYLQFTYCRSKPLCLDVSAVLQPGNEIKHLTTVQCWVKTSSLMALFMRIGWMREFVGCS